MSEVQKTISELGSSEFAAASSSDGLAWIAGLDEMIAELSDRWSLQHSGGAINHGYNAVVVPVIGPAGPAALKVAWPPSVIVDEERSLRAWSGRGAVKLYDADLERGALLLEQLDSTRSLHSIDLDTAAREAGLVLRELSIDAPEGIPKLKDDALTMAAAIEARRHLLVEHVPDEWIDASHTLLIDLGAHAGNTLVHTDLHYGNILAGVRQRWTAIDPKPSVGDPERSVAELLWTRADELEDARAIQRLLGIIVTSADLEWDKTAAWAFARTSDYWLWAVSRGLTIDPVRCHRVAAALAPVVLA